MIDDHTLAELLRSKLNAPGLTLVRLPVTCISKIYRADIPDRPSLCVKWGMVPDSKAIDFLRRFSPHPLLPRVLPDQPYALDGKPVYCFEWRSFRRVRFDQMSDAQFRSFLSEYRALFQMMQDFGQADPPGDGAKWHREIVSYAERHPLSRFPLKSLLALGPSDFRRPANASLAVTHGDFHSGNFGFDGDRLSVFLDFDNLVYAYPVEDLACAFVDGMRQGALVGHPFRRRRLARRIASVVRDSGQPPGAWIFAVNLLRLTLAAKTLSRHADCLRVAFNVAARDRRIRRILTIIRKALDVK